MKHLMLSVPVALLLGGPLLAQTATDPVTDPATGAATEPATGAATGGLSGADSGAPTYGTNWSLSVGSTFFTDADRQTMRTPEEIRSAWDSLPQEERDVVLAECERFSADTNAQGYTDTTDPSVQGSGLTDTETGGETIDTQTVGIEPEAGDAGGFIENGQITEGSGQIDPGPAAEGGNLLGTNEPADVGTDMGSDPVTDPAATTDPVTGDTGMDSTASGDMASESDATMATGTGTGSDVATGSTTDPAAGTAMTGTDGTVATGTEPSTTGTAGTTTGQDASVQSAVGYDLNQMMTICATVLDL
jgi:hypothetical protein